MDPIYLCLINMSLIFWLLYFSFFVQKDIILYILATMIISNIILSQLFWSNPEKNSIIHMCDAIVAKIVILTFIIYTCLYKLGNRKKVVIYLLLLIAIATSFYLSNHYSSKWCSPEHIRSHSCFHICCIFASIFVF